MELKQAFLTNNFGLEKFEKFNLDLENGEIRFLDRDILKAKAQMIPNGSFNSKSQTWMWAWANEAFPERLRTRSSKLKELEEIRYLEMFGLEMVDIDDEEMAWEITAIAVNHFNFQGAYRGPSNNTLYFYAINCVSKIP